MVIHMDTNKGPVKLKDPDEKSERKFILIYKLV